MSVVPHPDAALEALLQACHPLPFAVGVGVGDPRRLIGRCWAERKLKSSIDVGVGDTHGCRSPFWGRRCGWVGYGYFIIAIPYL